MKTLSLLVFLSLSFLMNANGESKAIIIDHNCCEIQKIPNNWIDSAKAKLRIAYGHTSHGSQIVTGLNLFKSLPNSKYQFNSGENSLYINDASALDGDLGNPDRTTWATRTRNLLYTDQFNVNTIMWSWCGQVDGSESDINTYLNLMQGLEEEFQNVKFVYMTGHLNGTGLAGNVHLRNEQIRKFCQDNNKALFDFADIESYDPDGNYFLDKNADDECNYSGGNWAEQWCSEHPDVCNFSCDCAHSHCLNCYRKGQAAWWMFAMLSGWEGIPTGVEDRTEFISGFDIFPNPSSESIQLSFDNSNFDCNVKIYDSIGNIVYKSNHTISNNRFDISISNLNSGIYTCLISSGNSTLTKRFAVVR